MRRIWLLGYRRLAYFTTVPPTPWPWAPRRDYGRISRGFGSSIDGAARVLSSVSIQLTDVIYHIQALQCVGTLPMTNRIKIEDIGLEDKIRPFTELDDEALKETSVEVGD